MDVFLDVSGILSDTAWVSQMFLIVIVLVLCCGKTFAQAKWVVSTVTLCVSHGVDPPVGGNDVTPEAIGVTASNFLPQAFAYVH